jgi:hypothetical protein
VNPEKKFRLPLKVLQCVHRLSRQEGRVGQERRAPEKRKPPADPPGEVGKHMGGSFQLSTGKSREQRAGRDAGLIEPRPYSIQELIGAISEYDRPPPVGPQEGRQGKEVAGQILFRWKIMADPMA